MDKYREQRHFRRLVHDNTVIGNISEIVVTVGYSSLLIKKFGNYIISLLYLIPFMIFVRNLKATQTPLNQSQHTPTKHAPIATYVYS